MFLTRLLCSETQREGWYLKNWNVGIYSEIPMKASCMQAERMMFINYVHLWPAIFNRKHSIIKGHSPPHVEVHLYSLSFFFLLFENKSHWLTACRKVKEEIFLEIPKSNTVCWYAGHEGQTQSPYSSRVFHHYRGKGHRATAIHPLYICRRCLLLTALCPRLDKWAATAMEKKSLWKDFIWP